MKNVLFFALFLFSVPSFAQPSKEDIIKFKIKRIVVNTQGSEEKTEYGYDSKGNDTAFYTYGALSWTMKYEKDSKGRIIKSKKYGPDGSEYEVTVYKYNPDGSFSTENKDNQYGLIFRQYFNKNGKPTKEIIPDGSERIYTYDAKGKLIKFHSIPKNEGVKFTKTFTYNTKGQLIATKNEGDYAWTQKLFYDAKGLLIKTETTSMMDEGTKQVSVNTYSYAFF